ncbi:MAG: aminotransferase class-III [Pedosphaera sp. Tous-C6FEB]|nr:MAG: aminotransferase class-III [Pedosphaera sp. Tous-C6FEB]
MDKLARLDHAHVWHPFTQMRDWLRGEPIVITSGRGAVLRDVRGREYLDANSSIWTNLHGHNHPQLNAALKRQLGKIAHSSALGFANEPASLLAEKLVKLTNAECGVRSAESSGRSSAVTPHSAFRIPHFSKVFFSDDGSTAMEVALKLAYEFTRRTRGPRTKPRFLSLAGAYHGDTVGAVSLGHVDLFHKAYSGLLFKTDAVMAPYCYRCPFNRAKPERADAREYRKCNWECVGKVEAKCAAARKRGNDYAAFVFEPRMQGAAGMIPQPDGWLKRVTDIARGHGALLVADEVMTGFGRIGGGAGENVGKRESGTGATARPRTFPPAHFLTGSASQGVQPDFLALAKGLTGGYLPMAATLTTKAVFDAFLGEYEEFKTFFHGHSFTGNQLGAAAGLASLELLTGEASVKARARLEEDLRRELKSLWPLPNVGDVRQVGLVAGVELVRDWRTREPFALAERAGIRVCEAMARRGVLTRPIGSVVVLMPPYCTTRAQVRRMVGVLREAVEEVFGARTPTSAAAVE